MADAKFVKQAKHHIFYNDLMCGTGANTILLVHVAQGWVLIKEGVLIRGKVKKGFSPPAYKASRP